MKHLRHYQKQPRTAEQQFAVTSAGTDSIRIRAPSLSSHRRGVRVRPPFPRISARLGPLYTPSQPTSRAGEQRDYTNQPAYTNASEQRDCGREVFRPQAWVGTGFTLPSVACVLGRFRRLCRGSSDRVG
jgi:hypothetical protein